jgi:hypothetical protein
VLEAAFLNASEASKVVHVLRGLNNNQWIQNKTDEALITANIHFNTDKQLDIFLFRHTIIQIEMIYFSFTKTKKYSGDKLQNPDNARRG